MDKHEIDAWLYKFVNELRRGMNYMSQEDAYALKIILETEFWQFIRIHYDEEYKIPY